jgi:hypothetical protein
LPRDPVSWARGLTGDLGYPVESPRGRSAPSVSGLDGALDDLDKDSPLRRACRLKTLVQMVCLQRVAE